MANKSNVLKPEGSRIYSYWSTLYMTFYSKRVYIDIGKRWKGFGVLYLLLVCCIVTMPFAVKMGINFGRDFNQQIMNPIAELPTLYVQNGVLTFDKPMPYIIKNKQGKVVIIVDTTGEVNDFNNKQYPYLSILLNKEKIGMRLPNPQLTENHSIPSTNKPMFQIYGKNANYIFNAKQFTENPFLAKIVLTSQLAIYPIVLGIFYAIFVVVFLTLAMLGQVFANVFFNFSLQFKQSCRFIMTASTPMLFLFSILLTLGWDYTGVGALLIAILSAYFAFSIYALKSESLRVARL